MIRSIKSKELARVGRGIPPKGFPTDLMRVVQRKLAMLDAAKALEDLCMPPGNRLEELLGDRKGQHSIRVNDQFRLCFVWRNGGVEDLEFVDYH